MTTPVIDVQVHAYERDHSDRPWHGHLEGPAEVTGDDMVAAMDAVGVDGAILVSPFSMYQYDASYALEVYDKHPGSFGLVRPFDPDSDTIEQEMEEWTSTPGVVGARIMLARIEIEADNPGVNQILAAGAKANVPINVMCSGKLPIFRGDGTQPSQDPNSSSTTSASHNPTNLQRRPTHGPTFQPSSPSQLSTTSPSKSPAPAPSHTNRSPTQTSGSP